MFGVVFISVGEIDPQCEFVFRDAFEIPGKDRIGIFIFIVALYKNCPLLRIVTHAIFKTPAGKAALGDVNDGFDNKRRISDGVVVFGAGEFDQWAWIGDTAFAIGREEWIIRHVVR